MSDHLPAAVAAEVSRSSGVVVVKFPVVNCYEPKWLGLVWGSLPSRSGSLGLQEIQ